MACTPLSRSHQTPGYALRQSLLSSGREGIPALISCRLGVEVKEEVGLPVVIHILHLPFLLRCLRPVGPESDAQGVNGGSIKAFGRQNGRREFPVALRVDGVGVAAGLDVDEDFKHERRFVADQGEV